MNRAAFYAAIRTKPFGGTLKPSQVSGIDAILAEWEKRALSDLRHLAYMLATAFHETARTMQPIAEYGKGKKHPYGKPGKHGQRAYGRGYVQLTWDYNYERADRELKLNGALIANYELALDPKIAAPIMFEGMIEGWFTGKKLSDYFTGGKSDWQNARRIINGTDKAATIAGYGKTFYAALQDAVVAAAPSRPPPAEIPAATLDVITANQKAEANRVASAQKRLRELGYYGVGMVDGDQTPKGMTDSAVLNFKNRNDLPPGGPFTTTMDAEFFAALAVASRIEVGAERATMTAADVREASPELAPVLNTTWWQKLVAAVGVFFGGIWTFFGGIVSNIKGAVENLEPVKDFLSDVPVWTWGVLIAAVAGGLFLMSRQTGKAAAALYNKGVVT